VPKGASIDTVKAFRVVWAENEDWAHASAYEVPYRGQEAVYIGPDAD
jgi:hypothetical protein